MAKIAESSTAARPTTGRKAGPAVVMGLLKTKKYILPGIIVLVLGIIAFPAIWILLVMSNKSNPQTVAARANWIPQDRLEDKNRWKGIIVHHSGTQWGNAQAIDAGHRQKDWEGLGYHFVINNGRGGPDGLVEVGYRWRNQKTGAHCRVYQDDDNYWNKYTIGICLVGDFEHDQPTADQYDSLGRLIRFLQERYKIPSNKILGHSDVKATTCPGKLFSWRQLHDRLKAE